MPYAVKTLVALVTLPGYGRVDAAQTTIILKDEDFALIPASAFSGSKVQNMGKVDGVDIQAVTVAAPAALTSVVAAGANPTKAEYDALRADVTALRTTLAAVLTALKVPGGPMASA